MTMTFLPSRSAGKKVIVIGIDGMDPRLSERLMKAGQMPNLDKLRRGGGFRDLGTSTPPQSPVAWATFINGAGPGSHGIFDFIHRRPDDIHHPFYSASEVLPPEGGWDIGEHRIQFPYWPINHKPATPVLRRQGVPFWDHLDAAGIPTTFYDLPSNYPASPSHYGHHRCLCGMGTPDMLGGYGTYQLFAEDGPETTESKEGGQHSRIRFDDETARGRIVGPDDGGLKVPKPTGVDFQVHRDRDADAAVIDVQEQRIVLKAGQWSRWVTLGFELSAPKPAPSTTVPGICRFYLQKVSSPTRVLVSPINIDPSSPAQPISEPNRFVKDISTHLGPFATTGFQELYSARKNNALDDDEYLKQANSVLEERLALLDYALANYDDGLLFFYFSSSDLQSHIFWWDSDDAHPIRTGAEARAGFQHIHRLYKRLDSVIGDIVDRYGSRATILVMSDHGFANFGKQFNLNTWLRSKGLINPPTCTSIMKDVDWKQTAAYGLGINGLYLNLKGREPNGFVEPRDRDDTLNEIAAQLMQVTDYDGQPVIRGVYRSDRIYSGPATALAPDLIVGYHRNYRASWDTILGDIGDEVLTDNNNAWSADHCADALEVPGVLFCNKHVGAKAPSLVDIAPTILAEFGLPTPKPMVGKNVLS
jgi:predicted AlkP superfamily phosphohydrolase/phosphomutase